MAWLEEELTKVKKKTHKNEDRKGAERAKEATHTHTHTQMRDLGLIEEEQLIPG